MCGIVGALIFKDRSGAITEPYLTRMRDTVIARPAFAAAEPEPRAGGN